MQVVVITNQIVKESQTIALSCLLHIAKGKNTMENLHSRAQNFSMSPQSEKTHWKALWLERQTD